MVEFKQAKGSVFMQEGLVYRTSTGIAVRSKSELLVYETLLNAKIQPAYEQALTLGGSTRYPDFTIADEISGRTIYWEHLGMLEREDYRKSWEKKLAWYRANKIRRAEDPKKLPDDDKNGILVTTQETSVAPFNLGDVQEKIRKYLQ